MDFIASRATLFGQDSRPVSRASSTTTEFTSRPLLREIDYIRSLISHATITSKPAEYSITAQVFRRPPQNVTQAQILQELDALRRRIKYETKKPDLPPADPETDTDDDFHDAIEYDDEYESMRRANEHKEHMIEDAEARVDKLADENEQIQSSVEALRQDLKTANALVDSLKARQATQDAIMAEMRQPELQASSDRSEDSEEPTSKVNELPEHDVRRHEESEHIRELRRQVDNLQLLHDKNLETAAKTTGEHQEAIRIQAESHNRRLDEIQREHEVQLSDKAAEYSRLSASHAESHSDAMAQMEEKYEAAMQSQAERLLAAQQEALRLQTEKHHAAITDMKQQHEVVLQTRQVEMEDDKRQAILQIEEANSERHEQEQAEIIKTWSARVAFEAAQHKANQDAHIEQLSEEHDCVVRRLEKQAEARITELQLTHQQETADLKQQQVLVVAKSEAKIQQALHSADAMNCQQKAEHTRNLSELKQVHADEQEDVIRKHRAELEALRAAHMQSLEESSHVHERTIVEMAAQHQDGMQALSRQLDLALETKKRQDQDCGEYKSQLAELREQLDQHATSSEQMRALQDDLRQQHFKQVEELEARNNSEHCSALKEAIEALTLKTYEGDPTATRDMHEHLLQAQRDLRRNHEAELSVLRSDQSKEVVLLREELDNSRRDYDALRALHASEVARLFAEREAPATRNGHRLLDRVLGKVDGQSATCEEAVDEEDTRDTPRAHSLVPAPAELGQVVLVHEKNEQAASLDHSGVSVPTDIVAVGHHQLSEAPIASHEGDLTATELESVQKAADEESEASTENRIAKLEAQVSELKNQLAAQSPSTRPRSDSYRSSGMQTAPRIEVIGSPKRSHKRNSSFPLSPTRYSFGSEIVKQLRWSDESQSRPTSPRPVTPMSPKRWSMQDYIEGESPSVVTASEAILTQKFQEHVSELQQARDRLARQYQERFDKLLAERKRHEKQITLEQAEEFVRERELLATRYLLQERESIQNDSEEQLVRQYHQRLVKKKSQIRLQHAQDFHDLTQDYDRRLQELMAQQDGIKGLLESRTSTDLDPLSPVEPLKSPSIRSSSSIPRLIRKPSSQFELADETHAPDTQHKLRRQSGSPNIKQRTMSSTSSQKSKRHSSGMIYDKSRLSRT